MSTLRQRWVPIYILYVEYIYLLGIPYIYDAASCQNLCQDTGLYPDCKYFIFDSKWSTCVLLRLVV